MPARRTSLPTSDSEPAVTVAPRSIMVADDEASSIVGQIEEASGRRVEANRTVDPDLIGGVVLKVGTLEVDSSVRGRLDRLRRELAGATT